MSLYLEDQPPIGIFVSHAVGPAKNFIGDRRVRSSLDFGPASKFKVMYDNARHSVELAGVDLPWRNHVCAFL